MCRLLSLISLLLFVCSCASPTTKRPPINHYDLDAIRRSHVRSSLEAEISREARINSIFYQLKKNTGPELCDKKLSPDTGIGYGKTKLRPRYRFLNSKAVNTEYDDWKKVLKQPEDSIWVRYVVPGSAADKAGIKKRDRIVSIYNMNVPTGGQFAENFLDIMEKHKKDDMPVDIEVERNGKILNFNFAPDMVCSYNLYIDKTSQTINAYADGEDVYLTSEIIDYMENDNDLAAVLSHELAHNTMGHIDDKKLNIFTAVFFGSMVDVLFGTDLSSKTAVYGSMAYSIEYEQEADYVSAFYMARAGYDYHTMYKAEIKLSDRDRVSLYSDPTTHPTPQTRNALLKETAREIDMKKAFKHDLVPDFKRPNKHLLHKRD